MLCEKFLQTFKHGKLKGRVSVRIDSLLELLIKLTTEAENERSEESRKAATDCSSTTNLVALQLQSTVAGRTWKQITGNGRWEVEDNGRVYNVREQFCPCDSERNNHCKKGSCKACPYAFTCNCALNARSGINYLHVHAALAYAPLCSRVVEEQRIVQSAYLLDSSEEEELVDLQEAKPLYVENDEEDTVPLRCLYTDSRDKAQDALKEIEMRSHLRCEEAKRSKTLDIPDCAPDERNMCYPSAQSEKAGCTQSV
ncbi:unnamed protein product [Cylicocyclus nassatus]|uniref:Uncharacterized protein n=1 Tax=Cylicocyclus nassatus TaxID=53992 RepID=A0AA36H2U7_CYLNA|nr:unnamed protein product [Cylicocyclus nassatus]